MGRGAARIYNLISLVFLLLTVGVLIWGSLRLLAPPPAVAVVDDSIPSLLELPTPTTTPTPRPTLPPTFTPTPTLTETLAPTATFTLTAPPSATITNTAAATFTPTISPTPSATPSETPTATPTGPTAVPTDTPSPYPFVLRGNQISLTTNFANSLGCNWQGLGGGVFDLAGNPFPNLRVHVFGGAPSVDLYTVSGSNSLYTQGSGWEIQVSTVPTAGTYFVELQTEAGTPVSPQVQIAFPGACAQNLALVNFEQTRPF